MISKTYPATEKLLQNGLELSQHLLDLLNKEADNLKNNADATSIASIAANKKETVSRLEQFSKQLAQILATEKLPLSSIGVADYFNKAESAKLNISASNKRWNKITRITKQCRLLNEKNGASINILAQYTQRSLRILKGKNHNATTYGPDGSTDNEQSQNSLISV